MTILKYVGVPGEIRIFAGSTPPVGWALCDGASFSTTANAALFAVIGYTYGGAGANFNVPDLRGRFPLGKAAAGTGSTLGATGGAIDHNHAGPSHSHTIAHTHQIDPPATNTGAPSGAVTPLNLILGTAATSTHTHSVDIPAFTSGAESAANSGNGGTGNTGTANPPFLALNFIIKT